VTAPVSAALLLTAGEARRLTGQIRDALALADDLLARAYAGRAWEVLGHRSFEAYCAAELPELRHIKLRKPEQLARVGALYAVNPDLTVTEIEAATGASRGTAHARLREVAGTLPEPAPAAPASPLSDRIVALLGAHPGGLDVFEVARRLKARQAQVSPALSRMAAAGRIGYRPGAKRGTVGMYVVRGSGVPAGR
jgi:hypothetical protein